MPVADIWISCRCRRFNEGKKDAANPSPRDMLVVRDSVSSRDLFKHAVKREITDVSPGKRFCTRLVYIAVWRRPTHVLEE